MMSMNSKERLSEWRSFKKEVSIVSDFDQCLDMVAKYWGKAPISSSKRLILDTSIWNSPWDIINGGIFDTATIAVLMAETLIHSKPDIIDKIRLIHVRDTIRHEEIILMHIIPDKWLNYNINEVAHTNNIDFNSLIVQSTYINDGRKYIEYIA